MADLLIKQATLALNTTWRQRVEQAMMTALRDTIGELVGSMSAAVYNKRQTFATAAINNPTAYLDRFSWAVTCNSTIAAAIAAPVLITSSTNATPIVVLTAAAHGYTTGDTVEIVGHVTNTAANGGWIITVTDSTHFSIPASGIGAGTGGTVTKQPNDSDLQFVVNGLVSDFAGVTAND